MNLSEIILQLKACGFTCEAGRLEDNTAWRELERMANSAPRPDWSQAPEWAMFHAINANGTGHWYQHEPQHRTIGWVKRDGRWHGDIGYLLPLGVDWRETLQRRPQVQP